ncbi:hypothetical protein GOODEAATRI_032644 [Goodea atripinnis]|uniref:Uncharacterized protein n=1 Tax=Goodea atripinnis TaxID=208336 RepID=A0ABV0MX18_9TELE
MIYVYCICLYQINKTKHMQQHTESIMHVDKVYLNPESQKSSTRKMFHSLRWSNQLKLIHIQSSLFQLLLFIFPTRSRPECCCQHPERRWNTCSINVGPKKEQLLFSPHKQSKEATDSELQLLTETISAPEN